MPKTAFDDTPPLGTLVTAAFLNALNNHRHKGQDADGDGAIDYAVTGGTGNAYTLTLVPALTANAEGMPIWFKADRDNAGAATLNVGGGAVAMKKGGSTTLISGDIKAGGLYVAIFDGTYYQIIGGALFAMLAGNSSQVFSAADGASGKQVVNISQFANSFYQLASYQKLPTNGFLQMGQGSIASGGSYTGSFPITYPNAVLTFVASAPGDVSYNMTGDAISTSQFIVRGFDVAGNPANIGYRYISFGY